MNKRIDIQCPPEIKDIVINAMRDYTEMAFPRGASDCALVARESMLESIAALEREYAQNNDGRTSYNKRLRAMVKEAIQLHYQIAEADGGRPRRHECTLLIEVVSGTPHTAADLLEAREADRRG